MFFVLLLVSFINHKTNAIDVCSSQFLLESDYSQEDCPNKQYYFPYTSSGDYQCFPECHAVVPNLNTVCSVAKPCPPGYTCEKSGSTKKCQIDEKSCMKFYYEADANAYWKAYNKPECEKDGSWKAKQCKGEKANGRCFCYDDEGNKIFGRADSNKADNMTCACSRKKAELLKDTSRPYASLHCQSNGNYEALQCDSGQCWCVEPTTGELTSKIVPESLFPILPCYNGTSEDAIYLRICESFEYANAIITAKMKIRGTNNPNLPNVNCDWDGAYGPVQVDSSSARCTWRDNSQIDSYQASIQERSGMDCNCARDKKYYEESGNAQQLRCDNNGNYYYFQQTIEGKFYCVDSDGFMKHEEFLDEMPDKSKCDNYKSF